MRLVAVALHWSLPTFLSLAGLVLAGCGPIEIAPPKAPDRILPELPDMPNDLPARGAGRIVLDTPGEHARVIEVTGVSQGFISNGRQTAVATSVATRPVCLTPCVVDLERGTHALIFSSQTDSSRVSGTEVQLGSKPMVLRHAMGQRIEHSTVRGLGSASVGLGILGILVGGTLYGTAALIDSNSALPGDNHDGLKSAGLATLGIGAALAAVGVALLVVGRPEVQPGATTEWSLTPEPPPPGASTLVQRTSFHD